MDFICIFTDKTFAGEHINEEESCVLMWQSACTHAVNTPHLFMLVTEWHANHVLIMSN